MPTNALTRLAITELLVLAATLPTYAQEADSTELTKELADILPRSSASLLNATKTLAWVRPATATSSPQHSTGRSFVHRQGLEPDWAHHLAYHFTTRRLLRSDTSGDAKPQPG